VYSIDQLASVLVNLNSSFEDGTVSAFAQDPLTMGPTAVPEPGTFILMAIGLAGIAGLRVRRAILIKKNGR
jgi:hypothetical protein